MNEVQVIITVVSSDKNVDPDIAGMIGASAALAISGIPFAGPLGAGRVGYNSNDGYLLNPTNDVLASSDLDMVVAGTESAVLMVESEAKELSEDLMLGAVLFAHQEMQVVIQAINDFAAQAGKPAWEWTPPVTNVVLTDAITASFGEGIKAAYQISDKMQRQDKLAELRDQAVGQFANEGVEPPVTDKEVSGIFSKLEKTIVRQNIIAGQPRIDGRDTRTVRPIEVETGVLNKTHGSALFTRGETQALVVATLGALRDAQIIEDLGGTRKDHFMLHYNFPPFSVGETGFMSGPKRREIGHGRLARRGVAAVLPSEDEFPYAIRVVS